MKNTIVTQNEGLKKTYEHPEMETIYFTVEDIITTSTPGDENQGDWDPQDLE
ncbi:MAG: hypothetical protein IJW99_09450 [Clostridia bacterium]|nr:hypothetical protein [Clostridia bacterium]